MTTQHKRGEQREVNESAKSPNGLFSSNVMEYPESSVGGYLRWVDVAARESAGLSSIGLSGSACSNRPKIPEPPTPPPPHPTPSYFLLPPFLLAPALGLGPALGGLGLGLGLARAP
jgi:hypothetical protein